MLPALPAHSLSTTPACLALGLSHSSPPRPACRTSHGCLSLVGSVPPACAWRGSGGALGGGLVRGGCVPP
eukprot:3588031-Alexandrium_andersonii.AAC.1